MSETPTNTPEATPEALLAEIQALRAKNVQLLAELKAAKAAATDATAAQEALQAERDAALADARALRLDGPVAALVADVAVDAELFRTLWDRHYRFALDDKGAVVILDAEGQPAMVTEPGSLHLGGNARTKGPEDVRKPGKTRPAAFTADDVRLLAEATPDADRFRRVIVGSRASDGGAASPGSLAHVTPHPAQPAAAPAQPFGLR